MFLTTSLFSSLLNFLKSTEVVFILSISNVSTTDFKLGKSAFLANFVVLMPVKFFKSDFPG